MKKDTWRSAVSGAAAGAANGLFGGGGGSVLVPLLTRFCGLEQRQAFSTSLAVILPLCVQSAAVYLFQGGLDLTAALPYLIGGTVGGWLGGRWFLGGAGGVAPACLRASAAVWGSEVPDVSEWVLPLLAGGTAGVLSGFGVGGGTLLLVYMTAFAGLDQRLAQGINLLYFLPSAAMALPAHWRNGSVVRPVLLPAILAGLLTAGVTAWVATVVEVELLRRCFGGFLIIIGGMELFGKERGSQEPSS